MAHMIAWRHRKFEMRCLIDSVVLVVHLQCKSCEQRACGNPDPGCWLVTAERLRRACLEVGWALCGPPQLSNPPAAVPTGPTALAPDTERQSGCLHVTSPTLAPLLFPLKVMTYIWYLHDPRSFSAECVCQIISGSSLIQCSTGVYSLCEDLFFLIGHHRVQKKKKSRQ